MRHPLVHSVVTAAGPLPDQNRADALVDRLRTAIWDGVYAPGDRLVERQLARQFGVSHIPLREALARLVEEGLVVRLPRRGARVASLSPRMLEELSSLRVVLEQFVVRRLHGHITPAMRSELQQIVDQMLAAAQRQDLVLLHETDQQFHQRLWELADHALLVQVAGQMRGRMNHFFRAAVAALEPDEMRRHAESHQELLDVITSSDRRTAERVMQRHVEAAAKRIADTNLTRTEDNG
ncbi:MAG TPA: GntR family transcriptional regulator [Streptosporangiaceae bacterium]